MFSPSCSSTQMAVGGSMGVANPQFPPQNLYIPRGGIETDAGHKSFDAVAPCFFPFLCRFYPFGYI